MSSEYVPRAIIGLLSAGLIVMVIPVLFFTVGKTVELRITKREIDRYFEYWCRGLMRDVAPHGMIETLSGGLKAKLEEPDSRAADALIEESNRRLKTNTFTWCSIVMVALLIIANVWAVSSNTSLVHVWLNALLATVMFVAIEIMVILVLLRKYMPLDINMVNKYIVQAIL